MHEFSERVIAIAATFVAEPVEDSLRFWSQELKIPFRAEFAPYNQVFQQLLDSSSSINTNQHGLNVILLRFEDWIQREKSSIDNPLTIKEQQKVEENARDLISALKHSSADSKVPYLIIHCPPSPASLAENSKWTFHNRIEDLMFSELESVGNVHLALTSELSNLYPVSTYYEPYGDQIGRVPYTSAFYTTLGTLIARKFHALTSPPYKVIVLDCDQTLWKGICGEDGPLGVEIDQPRRRLQEFMLAQIGSGVLVCICTKNNEEDVIAVFDQNPGMILKQNHIASWRINWKPKSENIEAMANELQLGLDSFIFLDDNPVECAEVGANCPGVLTLQLPSDPRDIPRYLEHVWAFDHLKVTEEDKKRTNLYRQNIKRERFREETLTFEDFLAGLELEITYSEGTSQNLARVAQLTQRTNQFNFTTIRRSEAEIQSACQSGNLECLAAQVSDRFGDYGLVGVILFGSDAQAIRVDTFLLSCRVLGRGVEHRMLAKLGEIAGKRGLDYVEIPYHRTQKNQPALDFLEAIGTEFKEQLENGFLFRFPTKFARVVRYSPRTEEPKHVQESLSSRRFSRVSKEQMIFARTKSEKLNHIAVHLNDAEKILCAINRQPRHERPDLVSEYMAPGSELERLLANAWRSILGIEKVGVNDNFFEIGGTSLKGVQLIAQLRKDLDKDISIVDLFERPTIRAMAIKLEEDGYRDQGNGNLLASLERGKLRRARARK